MKRKNLLLIPMLAASLLAGCGTDPGTGTGGGGGSTTDELKPLDLGPSFKEKYYPKISDIDQGLSGQITVALVFEGKESGWKAVADEYSRLHGGQVTVNIDNTVAAADYPSTLKANLESDDNPEWNIIQGNLMGGLSKEEKTVSFNSLLTKKNPYAGNNIWEDLMTNTAVDPTNKYILNSENLQTAWFVNKVAKDAAIEQGYETEDHTTDNPKTWVDLLNLLRCMKLAGYTNPLGLSLDKDSINSTQFSWLLRVYGDYYYRNEYTNIAENYGSYTVDVTSTNPESGFTYSKTRFFNTILGEGMERYVGANSEKFAEFVSLIASLGEYINPQNVSNSFTAVRNNFSTQTSANTLDRPQVMPDYLGSGLGFVENPSFKLDFFDNPKPKSEGGYVFDDTIVRDVGGNGGYLSVARHKNNSNVDNIALDFIRFFMTPYGQTIYYSELAKNNLSPQGITTVKNSSVVIPDAWKSFFNQTKVTFTGQSDKNDYLSFLIRYMSTSGEKTTANAPGYWGNLMTGKKQVSEFCTSWASDLEDDWKLYAASQKFDENCFMYPGQGTTGPYTD